jgi:hypothetical protein
MVAKAERADRLMGNRSLRFGLKKEVKINVSDPEGVNSRIFCAHMANSYL